jgi:hypothetical protein
MNRRGDIVIEPTFADAGDFFDGLAVVSVEKDGNTRSGYIDKSGQWVIQPVYTRADPPAIRGCWPIHRRQDGGQTKRVGRNY